LACNWRAATGKCHELLRQWLFTSYSMPAFGTRTFTLAHTSVNATSVELTCSGHDPEAASPQ